jgi:hypothetical protein
MRMCIMGSDAHAQKIMGHHFTSRIQATVTLVLTSAGRQKYDIRVVTYGITSMPNLMNFRPAILQFLNASKWISDMKTLGWMRLGPVCDAHAHHG